MAISRVKTLGSCIIEPMTFERLKDHRKSANLKYRLEEEKRLDELAQETCRNLIKKYNFSNKFLNKFMFTFALHCHHLSDITSRC